MMTFPQYLARKRAAFRAACPGESREMLLACVPPSRAFSEFLREAEEFARDGGTLSRAVLDSMARRCGESTVLCIFKGTLESGARGWLPPSVRRQTREGATR